MNKEVEIQSDWAGLLTKFPVGRKFNYLGRELIVTAHNKEYSFWTNTLNAIHIDCEYADNNGVLQEWRFHVGMAGVLHLIP